MGFSVLLAILGYIEDYKLGVTSMIQVVIIWPLLLIALFIGAVVYLLRGKKDV